MNLRKLLSTLLLCGLLLSACGGIPATPTNRKTPLAAQPATIPAAAATPIAGGEFPAAVGAAQQTLAAMLGIGPDAIVVAGYVAAEWGDACLNLGSAGELCAEVITPGYQVVLKTGEKSYVFHTNQDGSLVRQELEPANLPQAANEARRALAAKLDLATELLVSVVGFEAVQWPDSCLGISSPDVMCAQVITPGYRVLLQAGGKQYEYHTDQNGERVVPAQSALPVGDALATPNLAWESPDEPCQRLEIGARVTRYGECDNLTSTGPLLNERADELASLLAAYAPFQAETPAGTVELRGEGSQTATPAEQRAVAEWARLVLLELQSGQSSAEQGLALAWHREGGLAGFCSDLLVYVDGTVLATDCTRDPAETRSLKLDSAQLEQLYAWLDGFQAIAEYQADPATADAMTEELRLNGTGSQAAGEADRQALIDFAMALFQQAMQ